MTVPPVPYCSPYIPAPTAAGGGPLAFDPAWRSETVLNLAKGIEAERNYTRLPILADVLEEAGCDVFEILDHCRRCDGHHRGCWVMKLVLGRDPVAIDPFTPDMLAALREASRPPSSLALLRERLKHQPSVSSQWPHVIILAMLMGGLLIGLATSKRPAPKPNQNLFRETGPILSTPTVDHQKLVELGEQLAPKTRPTG